MEISDAASCESLEEENRKLKRSFWQSRCWTSGAEGASDKEMVGPAAKREAVAHLRNVVQMSRRASGPASSFLADRKMIRYRSRRPPFRCGAAPAFAGSRQPARRRFGYRRLFILLREQGEPSGINRIYRLYRRRRADRPQAQGSAESDRRRARRSWSRPRSTRCWLDFVHDQFAQGRRFPHPQHCR